MRNTEYNDNAGTQTATGRLAGKRRQLAAGAAAGAGHQVEMRRRPEVKMAEELAAREGPEGAVRGGSSASVRIPESCGSCSRTRRSSPCR